LSLFMARVGTANNANHALPANDPTVLAKSFY